MSLSLSEPLESSDSKKFSESVPLGSWLYECGPQSALSLSFFLSSSHLDPAQGDYEQGSSLITFGPATTNQMQCVNVTIFNNEDSEPEETFSIHLTAAQAPLVIDPGRGVAMVKIPQDS